MTVSAQDKQSISGSSSPRYENPTDLDSQTPALPLLEDHEMLEEDFSLELELDENTMLAKAIQEVKNTLQTLQKRAIDYAIKTNEAIVTKDQEKEERYLKLTEENNRQLKTFNQTLYRLKMNQDVTPLTKVLDEPEDETSFLRLNYKDLPHFQLDVWPVKPFPHAHAYQSVDTYLWDLEKLVNMSSNIQMEKHWKHLLPLVLDDKHARWIQDTVKSATCWEEAKDAFKIKFKSTRATVNATTEALTMTMNYKESIADYTTRFINKCELAELALDDKGIVERFVVSMTPEIYHQVAASWMPLRKSNDPTKWNVMEASNVARELLGDVVADYYSFYQTGKFTNGARRREGGNVPMPSGHTGATERRVFHCRIHGRNMSHNTVDCTDIQKKKTRNVLYGNINVPHSVAGPSTKSLTPYKKSSNKCRYCQNEWSHGHKCAEYYNSEEYKKKMQNKQVNAVKAFQDKKGKGKEDDSDADMDEYLGDIEPCKSSTLNKNHFKLKTPILLEDQELWAQVDTGSDITLLNKATFKKIVPLLHINYPHLNKLFITPINGYLNFAASDKNKKRIGQTIPLKVVYGEIKLEIKFEIMSFNENMDYDILLGTDVLSKLNIGLIGVQVDWIPNYIRNKDMSVNIHKDDVIPNKCPYGNEKEQIKFQEAIKEALDNNALLPKNSFCNLPESIIRLPMTEDVVVKLRQYPIPYSLRPILDKEIQKWYDQGVIKMAPINTRFNNPLTLASKKDREGNKTGHRPCLDVRKLNSYLPNDGFQLPLVKEIFESLAGCVVFTTLDLKSAYNQFQIHPKDQEKTAFTHNLQQYVFVGAPFGLRNMPGNFARVMTAVTQGMPFVHAFLDDLVVASKSLEEHTVHVNMIVNRLTEVNLILNTEKSYFGMKEVYLLGFSVSAIGTRKDIRKLCDVEDWKIPTNSKQVMSLLGTINYFRDYIPMISQITAPIDALRNETDVQSKWGAAQDRSFALLKKLLQSDNVLHHPDLEKTFYLHTEASKYGIAAALTQRDEYQRIKHIGFVSRSLSPSERLYNTSKRELLAIIFGLKKFHQFLYMKPFVVVTDHQALTFLQTQKVLSPLLYTWLETLLAYQYTVVHLPGVLNVLPDCLSRLYEPSFRLEGEDDFVSKEEKERLKAEKRERNKEKRDTKKERNKSLIAFSKIPQNKQKMIMCNTANLTKKLDIKRSRKIEEFKTRYPQTDLTKKFYQNKNVYMTKAIEIDYITPPEGERQKILKDIHSFGHFGGESMVKEAHSRGFHWRNLIEDAKDIVKKCPPCQKYNIEKTGYNPLKPIMALLPGDCWTIDMVGPFQPSGEEQYTSILVCMDICTKYIILRPVKNKMSPTIAMELVKIMQDFGLMKSLSSDNGPEFRNSVMHHISNALGIDRRYSIPYHARSRGAIENAVKITLQVLRKYVDHTYQDWSYFLPVTQLSINYKIRERTNSSAFSLMFARRLNDFKDYTQKDSNGNYRVLSHEELEERVEKMATVVFPAIQNRVKKITELQSKNFDKNHKLIHIENGTAVMCKIQQKHRAHKLAPVYQGPYIVVRKTNAGNYVLKDENGELLHRDYVPSELKVVAIDETIIEDDVYEVEEIRDHRGPPGNREYLVRWAGYGDRANTWEPVSSFTNPEVVIPQYWEKVKKRKAQEEELKKALEEHERENDKSPTTKEVKRNNRAPVKQTKKRNSPTTKELNEQIRRSKRNRHVN